jgi:hypothetical protein
MTAAGFPHSGITGSTPACGYPVLFAAYHALPRLSVPRHPPCALVRLTGISLQTSRIRSHSTTSHTHADPFPISLPNGEENRAGALPRPSLHTTLDPNCQSINEIERTRERKESAERTTFEHAFSSIRSLLARSRKEVIQPQVPLRLPCYDFAPVIELAFGRCLPCGLAHGLRALPTPMA